MSQETYKLWLPLDEIPNDLHYEGLHDDYEGFRILLRTGEPPVRTLRIFFEAAIGYRNINESYRLATWSNFNSEGKSSLFVVTNSSWITWIKEEAGGVLDGKKIIHYAIFTDEDCIEILSEFPPKVVWL